MIYSALVLYYILHLGQLVCTARGEAYEDLSCACKFCALDRSPAQPRVTEN
jgi:hypothetical protein